MSELRPAPTDRLGVPLPIIPSDNLPNIDRASEEFQGHHEFFLPSTARFSDIGARACRAARVLGVERTVHNQGPNKFHGFYDISDAPVDTQSQANVLLLSLAGYIPKQGVDLWSGDPIIRDLEESERAMLGEVDPERHLTIKNLRVDRSGAVSFLKNLVLEQSPINIDPAVLEEFTSTTKIRFTRAAGHEILNSSLQTMAEPVAAYYKEVRREGLLHPKAPVSAEALILAAFSEARRDKLLHPLREKLILRMAAAA